MLYSMLSLSADRTGVPYSWTKHGATALIKVFHGKKPQDAPGVYAAREVTY